MRIMRYEVQGLGSCRVWEQAVRAAKARAKKTEESVIVTAHADDGRRRRVQFNPDGSAVALWKTEGEYPVESNG